MKHNSKSRSKRRCNFSSMALPESYPWKVLGWLADDLCEFLTESEFTRVKEIVRSRSITDVLALSEDWGLQSMYPEDGSLAAKRAKYQLAALLKKFQFPTDREARKQAAVEKFLEGEQKCSWYNREGYTQLSVAEESWMVNVFTYARSFMQKMLGLIPPSLDVMTERSRHGPGATTDTENGQVSNYFKFEKWPYRCTARALRFARSTILADERWIGALEDDYRSHYDIPKWAILDRSQFWSNVLEVVDGNRIAFVPKNAKIMRSIAIEPTLNVYLQLGVDGFIRRRLKRWGVDLDHQEKNQEMARLGSMTNVDPFVTIDLANASNTISTKLVELLCPPDWYDLFMDLRSPCGDLESSTICYQMISSMGNGFTFALESALFAAVILAVMKETLGKIDTKEFAVYGDDLICRKSISERVMIALARCGFKVNEEKSCLQDGIRESCGQDWFHGNPVRPVFFDDTPKDVSQLFTDINRLKRILSLRWGIEESITIREMSKWIPEKARDLTGPFSDEVFDAYLHSPFPKGYTKNGTYRYQRLIYEPKEVKGRKFLFRKLMHDLHPVPPPSNKWEKRLTGLGSRFRVIQRNQDTLCVTCSTSLDWRTEYMEVRSKER